MQDNAKIEKTISLKKYVISLIAILVLCVVIFGYRVGYRIQSNFLIGKVGTITINIPLPNTTIYIDESKKITTTKDNEVIKKSLSPRKHSVIISREGYFPWKKDFNVPSNENVSLNPLFISQNASGYIITKQDKDYYEIRSKVIHDLPPSKESPHFSEDKTAKLWLDDNAITTQVGSTTTIVLQPDTIIKNVYFYKNRNDVVIFSTGSGIYVIETSKDGGQNFMPIYKGQVPTFIPFDANSIYVLDGETLMQVVI